jgi:hypothetical protein
MSVTGGWRCPLCEEEAEGAAEHLKDAHGVGGTRDRFGLRDAARHGTGRPPSQGVDGVGSAARAGEAAAPDLPSDAEPHDTSRRDAVPPVERPRPRPRPSAGRSIRRRGTPSPIEPAVPPARPAPLPPDAAVLRLVCASLEGVDAADLQRRLAELPGIEAVTIDLYERTADLFIDRRRAAPPHLVTLAMERIGLAVTTAELHRAPTPGQGLGDATRIFVVQ